ncbi:DNA pilot protein [Sigmofec virus UA08Rod_4577]|uniref:DNA pilot protein n=1 Tax=Sigmofec virus UA08Rod_4577 TaxID=2929404 RepID=A0A976R6R4_9VIRU|nr:DNA pilot protein [Sigmofec virus UA08Rod_4577]
MGIFDSVDKINRYKNSDNIWEVLSWAAGNAAAGNKTSRNRGETFSQTDVAKMMIDRKQWEDEVDLEQSQWEERSSIQGMANQYEQAGFNRVMATGIQPSSGSTPSGSGADNASSQTEDSPLGIAGLILDMIQGGATFGADMKRVANESQQVENETNVSNADVVLKQSEASKNKAEENYYASLTKGKDIENVIQGIKSQYADMHEWISVQKGLGELKSQIDDSNVKAALINLYGSEAALNESQVDINHVVSRIKELDEQQMQLSLKYYEQFQISQLTLLDTQVNLNDASAKLTMEQYFTEYIMRPFRETAAELANEGRSIENEQNRKVTDWYHFYKCWNNINQTAGVAAEWYKGTKLGKIQSNIGGKELPPAGTPNSPIQNVPQQKPITVDGKTYNSVEEANAAAMRWAKDIYDKTGKPPRGFNAEDLSMPSFTM